MACLLFKYDIKNLREKVLNARKGGKTTYMDKNPKARVYIAPYQHQAYVRHQTRSAHPRNLQKQTSSSPTQQLYVQLEAAAAGLKCLVSPRQENL